MAKAKPKKSKGLLGRAVSLLGSIPAVGNVRNAAKKVGKAKKAIKSSKKTVKKTVQKKKKTAAKLKKGLKKAKKKVKRKAKKKLRKKVGKVFTKARKLKNNLSKSKRVKKLKKKMKKTVLTAKKGVKKVKTTAKKVSNTTVKNSKKIMKKATLGARAVGEFTKKGFNGREVASAIVDFIPIVGNVKGAYEATFGKDPFTGRKLDKMERAAAGASILLGGVFKGGTKVVSGVVSGGKKATGKVSVPKGTGKAGQKASGVNSKVIEELEGPVIDGKRVGSGKKVDEVKPVWGRDEKGKPFIEKEFPHVSKEHGFSDVVDNYSRFAEESPLVGGDGIKRGLFQVTGSNNGGKGVFEWIVEPNGDVSHRRFIESGIITGKPNQIPKK